MERMFKDDGKLVFHKQTDPTAALKSTAAIRSVEDNAFAADNWHVGRIDLHVLEHWLREAGVKMSDRGAVREVIRKKLMDGDNAAWRVRKGSF